MPRRQIDPNRPNEDWQGNNMAIGCPVCRKVFIVSGILPPLAATVLFADSQLDVFKVGETPEVRQRFAGQTQPTSHEGVTYFPSAQEEQRCR